MNVGDVMSREVEFIGPEASAQDAAEGMGEIDVGALPVGAVERLHGIVTDRDILYRVVAKGLDPATAPMAANHVRRMPVQDPDGARVVGWITLADISRTLIVGSTGLQQALRELTES